MARIIQCRFCTQDSINHDHDDCAKKFGKNIEKKILQHATHSPQETLPVFIQEALISDKWIWYKEYLERQKENQEIEVRMNKIQKRILFEIHKILDLSANKRRLRKLNVGYKNETFIFRVTSKVEVLPNPRY